MTHTKGLRSRITMETLLFGLLCTGELSGIVSLLLLYRVSAKPDWQAIITSPLTWICLLTGFFAVGLCA